jgi:molybdopterin molybdotransferase
VALLSTLDLVRVTVARRPVVSILSTGDELRDAGERDRGGGVVDSNGPALAALVRHCGGEPRAMPFARDTLDATRVALERALDGADLVLTVGGVSVGEHDLVRPALEAAGLALDFWRVAIKPGKPLAVARAGNKRFLGLPGNPTSALLTFALFGAPLLRAMQGDRAPVPAATNVRLRNDASHAKGRMEFVRALLEVDDAGEVHARVLQGQSSGSVTSMAWADALVWLPADVERIAAGGPARAVRLAEV